MKSKGFDILILVLLLVAAVAYANVTKDLFIGHSIFTGIVFAALPVIYLGLRQKKNWKKIIVATLIFGGLFGFIFEFIAEFNLSYTVLSVVSPFKLFGVLPIDNIIGHMLMTMFTIVFYEHFIDREINKRISKNFLLALLPALCTIAFIILAFYFHPTILKFGHPYFFMGLAAIVPTILLGIIQPKYIRNMAETAIFFFCSYFIIEIFAVKLNYWIYPGDNYIGWVTVFNTSFPFEELFFWMLFYAATLVAYYEIFIDINKRETGKIK